MLKRPPHLDVAVNESLEWRTPTSSARKGSRPRPAGRGAGQCSLSLFDPTPVGQLTKDDLKKLRDALIAAETMETRDLNRVCKALAAAL